MKKEEELPEVEIEEAEERGTAHRHGSFSDEALLDHLRNAHRLDTPEHLSRATLDGVHDRLHHESDAADS